MLKHKHADLMLQYAQDAAKTDKPWELWEYNYPWDGDNFFGLITHPSWDSQCHYRRIKDKTDLEKYGVQKGDIWYAGSAFVVIRSPQIGEDRARTLDGDSYLKEYLTTLLFRSGVVDKL